MMPKDREVSAPTVMDFPAQTREEPAQAREEMARQIVARYLTRLKALVRAILNERIRQREGTTAIVQDAFASFFKNDIEFNNLNDIWPLLAAITRNKALHAARWHSNKKRNVALERPISSISLSTGEFWLHNGVSHIPTTVDAVIQIEIIESLTNQQRRLYELLIQGASKNEIADKLDCSVRTVERMTRELCDFLLQE